MIFLNCVVISWLRQLGRAEPVEPSVGWCLGRQEHSQSLGETQHSQLSLSVSQYLTSLPSLPPSHRQPHHSQLTWPGLSWPGHQGGVHWHFTKLLLSFFYWKLFHVWNSWGNSLKTHLQLAGQPSPQCPISLKWCNFPPQFNFLGCSFQCCVEREDMRVKLNRYFSIFPPLQWVHCTFPSLVLQHKQQNIQIIKRCQ